MCVSSMVRHKILMTMSAVMALNLIVAGSYVFAEELWCTTAATKEKEPAAMGKELAQKAKEGCKDRTPKLILLFGPRKSMEEQTKLIAALGEQLDKQLIYGCQHYGAAITQETNEATASIVVLGGDLKVTAAKVEFEKTKMEAAKVEEICMAFSEKLKPAWVEGAGKGRLTFIFGSCNPYGMNPVKALRKVIGDDVRVFGAATAQTAFQYFQGAPLQENAIGVVLTGDFSCGFSMLMAECEVIDSKKTNKQKPESIGETAQKAAQQAIGDKKNDVVCLLVSSCCSRWDALMKAQMLPVELKGLTNATSTSIGGLYGEGEIGQESTDKPAKADAYKISVCAIMKTAAAKTGEK